MYKCTNTPQTKCYQYASFLSPARHNGGVRVQILDVAYSMVIATDYNSMTTHASVSHLLVKVERVHVQISQLHGYYKKTNDYFFASVSRLLVKVERVHVQISQPHGYYKKTNDYFFASFSHLLVKVERVHVQISSTSWLLQKNKLLFRKRLSPARQNGRGACTDPPRDQSCDCVALPLVHLCCRGGRVLQQHSQNWEVGVNVEEKGHMVVIAKLCR